MDTALVQVESKLGAVHGVGLVLGKVLAQEDEGAVGAVAAVQRHGEAHLVIQPLAAVHCIRPGNLRLALDLDTGDNIYFHRNDISRIRRIISQERRIVGIVGIVILTGRDRPDGIAISSKRHTPQATLPTARAVVEGNQQVAVAAIRKRSVEYKGVGFGFRVVDGHRAGIHQVALRHSHPIGIARERILVNFLHVDVERHLIKVGIAVHPHGDGADGSRCSDFLGSVNLLRVGILV